MIDGEFPEKSSASETPWAWEVYHGGFPKSFEPAQHTGKERLTRLPFWLKEREERLGGWKKEAGMTSIIEYISMYISYHIRISYCISTFFFVCAAVCVFFVCFFSWSHVITIVKQEERPQDHFRVSTLFRGRLFFVLDKLLTW